MPRRRLAAIFAVLIVSAVGFAACGGDDSDDSGSSTDDTSSDDSSSTDSVDVSGDGDAVELEMTLDDFTFGPNAITAAAGQELTIALENVGGTDHTFTGEGVDEELAAGDSTTVTVTVPDGGFEFVCRFHESQGMVGEVTTAAGGAGGSSGSSTTTATTSAPTSGGGAPGY